MEIVIFQNPALFGGYFKHLDITKEAAQLAGNTVTVLEPMECEAVTELRSIFKHNSPNPEWFERWCFERWLLLDFWMNKQCKAMVFHIDSDTLVFSNMDQVWSEEGNPAATFPYCDCFVSRARAAQVSNWILDAFRNGHAERLCQPRHISDQNFLVAYGPDRNLSRPEGRRGVVDCNLYDVRDCTPFEGHKDIWFVNGLPCWVRGDGLTPMHTLHCWGKAKPRMPDIWQQSRQSIACGYPVRLVIGK